MNEIDERLKLRHEGQGRDVARRPDWDGSRPLTRSERREAVRENAHLTVGSYGTRGDEITSFAATTIPFLLSGGKQTILGSPGALRGISIAWPTRAGDCMISILDGSKLIAVRGFPGNTAANWTETFGDFGINFGSLVVTIVGMGADEYQGMAALHIATVE